MSSSVFRLEREFKWDKTLNETHQQQSNHWKEMNHPGDSSKLLVPIHVESGVYHTSRSQLIDAYNQANSEWAQTLQDIIDRLRDIRTDKKQYQINLLKLEQNDTQLRQQLGPLAVELYPPLPDYHLHFVKSRLAPTPNYPWQYIIESLDSNTLYYHQEMGKYNILKREECHLASVFMQLEARRNLWIYRERMKLLEYEIIHSELFKEDVSVVTELMETRTVEKNTEELPSKKRQYFQAIEYCHCENDCDRFKTPDDK